MSERGADRAGPGSLSALRTANRARLLSALETGAWLSQADLARATGLSPASVSGLVGALTEDGEIIVDAGVSNGRRSTLVRRAPGRRRRGVGIDLGRTHVTVVVGSSVDLVDAEVTRSLPEGHSPQEAVAAVDSLVREACAMAMVAVEDVAGVVAGVPRPVVDDTGTLIGDPSLTPWGGFAMADALSETLGCSVVIENDANLGAVALAGTAGLGDPLVFLKIGTGIGAGIAVDGRLLRGGSGRAGNIGHLTVDPTLAMVCRCGRRGCLETIASARSIRSSVSVALDLELTLDDVLRMVADGHPVAGRVVEEAAEVMGRALGWTATLLNPQDIIVGGPLARAGEALMRPLRRGFEGSVVSAVAGSTQLMLSPHGERTEVLGALALSVGTPNNVS